MECPQISVKSNRSIVSFKTTVVLLIFCLDDVSIDVSRVLKSPASIVLLSISPFMSVSICFIYLGAHVLGTYMLMSICPLLLLIPFIII